MPVRTPRVSPGRSGSSRFPRRWPAFVLALLLAGCAQGARTTAPATPAPAPVPEAVVESGEAVLETPAETESALDTVRAGRFDYGKMWTFDNPPLDYFREAYSFSPDSTWFQRARLGTLRIPGCTASFVSADGLLMTNHHCAREHIVEVSQPGENLLDEGFYAATLTDERLVEELYAEQLIRIVDVTAEVEAAAAAGQTDAERISAREEAVAAAEARLLAEAGGEEAGMSVEVIALYNGGQYSAYLFRRFEDVRLVLAPEFGVAYFGGDPDNFTYPRYNLDMTFFRVYGDDGAPLETEHYFRWSENGSAPGEVVFVVGNPGSTSRLSTVAQLEFRRDYQDPMVVELLRDETAILNAFTRANKARADSLDLRTLILSLENQIKAMTGTLEGLRDPVLMARRRDAERQLQEAIRADAALNESYGDLLNRIAALQQDAARTVPAFGAFIGLNPSSPLGSSVLKRGLYGLFYTLQRRNGVSEEQLAGFREALLEIEDKPVDLEEQLIAARFRAMEKYMGSDHPVVQAVLENRTPEEAARAVARGTTLADSAGFVRMLRDDFLNASDPAVDYARDVAQAFGTFQQEQGVLAAKEQELSGDLARARFQVYGTSIPPDATFSLRIADGVVKGYPYNGTVAAPYTTFYGLYDHYYAYDEQDPWDLPARWLPPPAGLDLSTPFNLVSTNDIIGGNSGSPLLNRDLQVVGLVFDGNIESLPGEFIYTDTHARTVSVDSRAILEAIESVYRADRILLELRQGEMAESERKAALPVQN